MELRQGKPAGILAALLVLELFLLSGTAVHPEMERGAAPVLPVPEDGVYGTPIRIAVEQLPPGEEIGLGAFPMTAGTVCEVLLTWEGGAELAVECQPGDAYPLESGMPVSFAIPSDGFYSFPIRSRGEKAALELKGTIRSYQDPGFVPKENGSGESSAGYASFEFGSLPPGGERDGARYSLERGESLSLLARVDEGTLTVRLLGEDGTLHAACRLEGHATGSLTAVGPGSYRLVYANEGTEPVRDAFGLVLRKEPP